MLVNLAQVVQKVDNAIHRRNHRYPPEKSHTLKCMVPRETVSFVFPRVLMFPRDEVEGNIRTRGKLKLTSFLRDHILSVLYI